MRIGQGWDIHKLEKGEDLIIGGVKLNTDFGTIAHSDGDVLIHAIIDAIFGAASMDDIGVHFPDTDKNLKKISSLELLKTTGEKLKTSGYEIINIDSTIILETPKLRNSIYKMRNNIAESLKIDISKVSVKAKTSEKIGIVGSGLAIEAMSAVLID